ncbi:MAG TPA: hypothetical protein EYP25_13505 [Anaerolineae bacterium]|nr:hypothetical protein [Caldilineae bacterium]HID35555.1 hypothetical protein [Anaerolineae bacterium]HIQ11612.1 hypothetical protein [Caldilineales bacterium]
MKRITWLTLPARNIYGRLADGLGNLSSSSWALANSPWDESGPALAASESGHQHLAAWVWGPAPTPRA